MLSVENLTSGYGRIQALHGVSLTVAAGEIVTLVGANGAEIEAIIRRLTRDGITVVLVEHDMRLVMNVSDRVHVLANGRTLAEGTAAEVRANPAVIEAYLGVRGARESTRAVG